MKITVLAVGPIHPRKLAPLDATFDVVCCATDDLIGMTIARVKPHVILTLHNPATFPVLMNMSLEWRRRWVSLHYSLAADNIAQSVRHTFLNTCAGPENFPNEPLVSVFTAAYNTPMEHITRMYASLCEQTYRNWEWVLYDDSAYGRVFTQVYQRFKDPRIRIYAGAHSGNIGEVKRRAASLCDGQILVEADHDDELTPRCLTNLVGAFNKFPDAGFAYSNWCEMKDDGTQLRYGDGWAYGHGKYRSECWRGVEHAVAVAAPITNKTIRHLTSCPNHVRAWRANVYREIGGHNRHVHVADDFELMIRTFLKTKMVHVDHFGYIQYHHDGNTQTARNAEIQRLVRLFAEHYDKAITARCRELNVVDGMPANYTFGNI